MNIIVDICHPGQVHLLRNLINKLKENNHVVIVTVKHIPSAIQLLELYNINFVNLGYKSDSIVEKALYQIIYNYKVLKLVQKYKIELGIGSSVTLAQVSRISKMNSILLDDDDDDVEPLIVRYAHPLADVILSPSALINHRKRNNTVFYNGYHELAYLHTSLFTPDVSVLEDAGIKPGERYFILRFNSFKAHHDKDAKGLSFECKRKIIDILKPQGKVFISTEGAIYPEFEQYKISIPPHKIHSFLYYSTLFIGDSQTMTSEAAMLGVPSIRSNSFVGRISYLEEEEHKYGLTYGYKPEDQTKMFEKIIDLLNRPNLRDEWQKKRFIMLNEKINVTQFLLWFVENYPESMTMMKNNPSFADSFK
jgi:uncharacterized protein